MRDFNKIKLAGRVYNFALEESEKDGISVIRGTVTVEVNKEGTLVDVNFWSPEKWKSGKANSTYTHLLDMVNGETTTIAEDGEDADWISIDANLDAQAFAPKNTKVESIDDLKRSQRVRGAFINANNKQTYQNEWKVDCFITGVTEIEEDLEKNILPSVRLEVFYVDEFRGRLMGAMVEAVDEAPMTYLKSLTVSREEPIYTSLKGEFKTRVTEQVKEGAFGEDDIVTYKKTVYALTWMAKNPYDFYEVKEDYEKYMVGYDAYRKEQLQKTMENGDETEGLVF